MDNCVFCKIINGEISTEFVAETDSTVAINDINPSADTHILIIPKKHIASFLDLGAEDDYLGRATEVAQKLIREKNIEGGYKLTFNGGKYQEVKHVHWHLRGGEMKDKSE